MYIHYIYLNTSTIYIHYVFWIYTINTHTHIYIYIDIASLKYLFGEHLLRDEIRPPDPGDRYLHLGVMFQVLQKRILRKPLRRGRPDSFAGHRRTFEGGFEQLLIQMEYGRGIDSKELTLTPHSRSLVQWHFPIIEYNQRIRQVFECFDLSKKTPTRNKLAKMACQQGERLVRLFCFVLESMKKKLFKRYSRNHGKQILPTKPSQDIQGTHLLRKQYPKPL